MNFPQTTDEEEVSDFLKADTRGPHLGHVTKSMNSEYDKWALSILEEVRNSLINV